jgi:glycosidase/MoaA/NifB/PqqE/SkfB family radical SAM enzyme
VVLRLPPGVAAGGLGAEVRGEFSHFLAPLPLHRAADGQREATVHVGPGAYAYKFRTDDGCWHLDTDNPRTRSWDGLRNSLLVVDGAVEPVLHAPAHPFLHLRRDGRLCVRAGLRKGATGAQLTVRWQQDEPRTTAMRLVAEEDEHLLFEAELPTGQREVEYLFVLASGQRIGHCGGGGQAFRVAQRELLPPEPAWWADAVVYTVLLDRFRRQGGAAFPSDQPEQARLGGDLWGLCEALPYLADLGINTLHLTPVGSAYSAHRYDGVNPMVVDPALGGEAALRALLTAADRRGMRVLLDIVLTHVHRDFLPFCDVRARGWQSPYAPWFQLYRFPFVDGPYPGYQHYQKGQWQEPLFNLDSEEVAAYLVQQCVHAINQGAAGLRLDAAADVPLGLLRLLRAAVRAVRPDAVLLGEVTPDNAYRYTDGALDCATDFPLQQAMYDWLWHRRKDARGFAAATARRAFWRGPNSAALAFTATHDQPRLRSLVGDERIARLAHLLLLTRPEVPAIYYGDELGLHSERPARGFEDAWPDRLPMPWPDGASPLPRADAETRLLFQRALRLRAEHAALRRGDLQNLATPDDAAQVLAFRRQLGPSVIEVYAHGTDATVTLPLDASAPAAATVLLALGEAALDDGVVRLGPYAALVVERHPAPAVVALSQALLADNRARCAESFRRGQLTTLALPSTLYLTVTERCNLRCQHCITDAPQRTASGRARTMQPFVLDALGDALAAADYFGFAHGGESLVAPIFKDALRRIQKARREQPYTVHLLSNGMLLTPQTVDELVDLGINSLAVSLDGVTAETNDTIRLGADLRVICHNLRHAVALRQKRGADLRIGISTVVLRDNVDELVALGQLAVELGIDWIKVEETFVMNDFTRHHALLPRARRAQQAVQALRSAVEPAGIVVIDHLAPPAGCPCTATDPAYAEFRSSDDFANRARFLPCRAAWEILCVDPDGTVHPVDYAQPALGSLLHTPLVELWNGEPAQRLRREALHRIAAAQRQCCRL